ncbi:PIN domain-containing protein [Streptomyces sp. PKU-EA00015]|uniref:PIN domain-containing protein n=1 Tax=Streptomyces sp. PKU-EA00015 TaxID=2748326 RepID=UPI0015A1F34D|nr:PIN domain-containing protein [Streptomyces sp. PKU-EA00015]NWF27821.1 PIN domain-containing protein [Streptomyces sp. PKU-EA00015]
MNVYLLDSTALWRMTRDKVLRAAWQSTVMNGDVRSCYPQRVEFLRSARDLKEFEAYSAMFAELYDDVPVPKGAAKWIGGLQLRAAERGAHQALSAVDLQICATAAHHGLIVLHDDKDFVTAARFAVELQQHNVHDGPR